MLGGPTRTVSAGYRTRGLPLAFRDAGVKEIEGLKSTERLLFQKTAGKRLESGPMVDQFSFRELIEIHEGQANPAFAARTVSAHLDPPTTTSQGNRVAIFGRGPSRLQRLLGR